MHMQSIVWSIMCHEAVRLHMMDRNTFSPLLAFHHLLIPLTVPLMQFAPSNTVWLISCQTALEFCLLSFPAPPPGLGTWRLWDEGIYLQMRTNKDHKTSPVQPWSPPLLSPKPQTSKFVPTAFIFDHRFILHFFLPLPAEELKSTYRNMQQQPTEQSSSRESTMHTMKKHFLLLLKSNPYIFFSNIIAGWWSIS